MRRLLLPALAGVVMLSAVPGLPRSAGAAQGDEPSAGGAAPARTGKQNDPSLEILARLARAELLAGLTPVEGPGLTVSLRHSSRKPARGADRSNYLLHDRDVNFILNALRAAGAEALAISGAGSEGPQRVTSNSVVVETRAGFQVNGTEIKVPLQILAIGEAVRLRAELMRRDGAIKTAGLDVLQMVQLADMPVLRIPAARHLAEFRFARVPGASSVVAEASLGEPARPVPSTPAAPATAVAGTTPASSPGSLKPETPRNPAQTAVKPSEPSRPAATAIMPRELLPSAPQPATVADKGPEKPPAGEPVAVVPSGTPPQREPKVVAVTPRSANSAPPVQAPVEAPAARPAVTGPVFGGKGYAKYHVAGCRFGERIGRQERITFASPEEAAKGGRKPCSICCSGRS